ncbi:hypothetical protein K1X76_05800 [bacterium]|nr:hypothetical protein [bacterium]
MKKVLLMLAVGFIVAGYSTLAKADGCYICSGGSYVKYSGDDTQEKRKAAKECGCQVSGTRGECDAANLTILCSVQNEKEETMKVAVAEKE